ncbi:pyruvate kinase [bacterium]|nr:pyruvate kinase [bacterium]
MKTEILATVGPASINMLKEMREAGMSGIRINSSHSDSVFQTKIISEFRRVDPAGYIVFDIKGPKIRIGDLPEPLSVRAGMEVVLRTDMPAPANSEYPKVFDFTQGLPITFPKLDRFIQPGHRLLVDDGYVGLLAVDVKPGRIVCKVMYGNRIRSRKGLNHPDTVVDFPYTMPHDEPLLTFATQQHVEYIADSFTRNAEDVLELRSRLSETGIQIVSKIENPEAVRCFDEILEVTDAVMIARGDLGVEMDPWLLPELQKTMIEKCNQVDKPVITATQMLESMIDNPHPSRADVSDIANAIYDGTDVVMLSGETSIGKYPVACVDMMRKIAHEVEQTERYRKRKRKVRGLRVKK